VEEDTKTIGAELNSEEPDLILPPEEQDIINPIISLAASAAPTYFEVDWKRSLCPDLGPELKAGFSADSFYRAGRGGKRLTPDARASMVVCSLCPIRAECANHGMSETGGIWGALTPQMRDDNKVIDERDLEWFARAGEVVASEPDTGSKLDALREFVNATQDE
jgi:hypothetical protein